jgi:lysophospholipase L1-like esterase
VQVIVRRYAAAGKTVTLQNLGVPGATLSRTMQDIGNQVHHGVAVNFVADEMPFVKTDSTLVTVFAGGNDANALADGAAAGLGGADPTAWLNTEIQGFGRDMTTLVAGIHARAPKARIIILNLPNLAALPYASGRSASDKRVLQMIAVGLNAQVNTMIAQGATVVDMMCDSRLYNPAIFSSDGFHPNDTGYSLFADLIYAAAATTSSTAPQSSCAFMSVY